MDCVYAVLKSAIKSISQMFTLFRRLLRPCITQSTKQIILNKIKSQENAFLNHA